MLLGVVSDSHGNVANTRRGVRMLESLQVEAVVHCGDIGDGEIPPLFAAWPSHFVFGNCDGARQELAREITSAGMECHDCFADLTLAGRRIAVLHSDDHRRFLDTIASQLYDLVCYGHTHVAEQHREGQTLVLNPGALYRASPLSIAVVDLVTLTATIVPLT